MKHGWCVPTSSNLTSSLRNMSASSNCALVALIAVSKIPVKLCKNSVCAGLARSSLHTSKQQSSSRQCGFAYTDRLQSIMPPKWGRWQKVKLLSVCLSHASSSKRCILKLSLQQNTNTKTPCWNSSPLISVAVNGVDCYGTGETCPRQYLDWGPQYLRSQLKSSCLYLLISWHFISPKRIFYFNVDKEASASGGLHPPNPIPGLCPWIPLQYFHHPLLCPQTMETDRCH